MTGRSIVVGAFAALSSATAHATPPPGLAAPLYERGNLRVAVACAETPLVDGSDGLRVFVDGEPGDAIVTNVAPHELSDADGNIETFWNPTDIGYLVPFGHHRVRIEAPDCVATEREIDFSPSYAERVTGRLEPTDPDLHGPTGAPGWYSVLLGYGVGQAQLASSGSSVGTSYTTGDSAAQRVSVSTGLERRHFAVWFDEALGWGSTSGTLAWQEPPLGDKPAVYRYSGSFFENRAALRVGARAPLGRIALEAGTGVGLSLVDFEGNAPAQMQNMLTPPAPTGMDVDWYVPVWSSITFKPACNWGVQALVSYDVEPSNGMAGHASFLAGVELQPTPSCAEPIGIDTRP